MRAGACGLHEPLKDHRTKEREIQELLDRVDPLVAAYDGPTDGLAAAITAELERSDLVARATTPVELGGSGPADDILAAYRNSYIPGRRSPFPLWTSDVLYGKVSTTHPANWGIVVEYSENTQLWTAGSAHGSSYRYDREVPIVLLGADIEPGVADTAARTADVATTLAALAGISFPDNVAVDAFMPPTRSAGMPNRILIDQKGRLAWVGEPSDRLEDAEAARKIASDVLSSPQGRDPHVLYVLGNLDTPTP